MKPILVMLLFALLLSACTPAATPTPANPEDQAAQTLTDFFAALNRGDYAAAEALFGDDYEVLIGMNSGSIPASDHVALWKQACQSNGFQCLKIKEIVSSTQLNDGDFALIVHFANADGSLFVQNPCCGEDLTTTPPVSEFTYEVKRNDQGKFQVMDTPPYVP
ncbi:MAG: hypothetical protein WA821_24335 [Anaerolineales bacterium]